MRQPPVLVPFERIAVVFAIVAGSAVALLSVLIVFDIVARSLFAYSLQGTDELGGYTLAVVGSLGFTHTLLKRGHPRIDVFLNLMPVALRRVLHVVAYAALAGFALFMTWHATSEFGQTIAFGTVANTPLQTPLWVPQLAWIVGLVVFTLTAFVCTGHAVWLWRRAPERLESFYGTLSVEDEVQDYVGGKPASPLT